MNRVGAVLAALNYFLFRGLFVLGVSTFIGQSMRQNHHVLGVIVFTFAAISLWIDGAFDNACNKDKQTKEDV
ncbi:MAG: hypothetical protein K0R66_1734 [Gammaproteobacteria bacterium]|jgi:hypothetical protein|nr:hypothetical protein [Gammaproteobacteria bacterium]